MRGLRTALVCVLLLGCCASVTAQSRGKPTSTKLTRKPTARATPTRKPTLAPTKRPTPSKSQAAAAKAAYDAKKLAYKKAEVASDALKKCLKSVPSSRGAITAATCYAALAKATGVSSNSSASALAKKIESLAKSASSDALKTCLKNKKSRDACEKEALADYKSRFDSKHVDTSDFKHKLAKEARSKTSAIMKDCQNNASITNKSTCATLARAEMQARTGSVPDSTDMRQALDKEARSGASDAYEQCHKSKHTRATCDAIAKEEIRARTGTNASIGSSELHHRLKKAAKEKLSEAVKECRQNKTSEATCKATAKADFKLRTGGKNISKVEFERYIKSEATKGASDLFKACQEDSQIMNKTECKAKAMAEFQQRSGKNATSSVDFKRSLDSAARGSVSDVFKACKKSKGSKCEEKAKREFAKRTGKNVTDAALKRDLKRAAKAKASDLFKACTTDDEVPDKATCKSVGKRELKERSNATEVDDDDLQRGLEKTAQRRASEVIISCAKDCNSSAVGKEKKKKDHACREACSPHAQKEYLERTGKNITKTQLKKSLNDVAKTVVSDMMRACNEDKVAKKACKEAVRLQVALIKARPARLRSWEFFRSHPDSNETFCVLNRQRGLSLPRPTAAPHFLTLHFLWRQGKDLNMTAARALLYILSHEISMSYHTTFFKV